MRQIRRKRFGIIEKSCQLCKKWKPLSEYYRDIKAPDEHSYICKICDNIKKSKYREEHRALCSARVREHKLKKFGFSFLDYNRMYKQQKGKCAICSQQGRPGRRLCIDHNHKTKEIRGLLCDKCNVGLGCFNDNLSLLNKALQYLQKSTI